MCIYGYPRISTKKQSIERQIRNIKEAFPNAVIIEETYSGTTIDRPQWNKLYSKVKANDTIVFDSVSRMSRNAEEGVKAYFELYERGIELVFLKERHIDTKAYKDALNGIISTQIQSGDSATDNLVNAIMDAINAFMRAKVKADIEKAFEQAEKEVEDLHQRTREGIETARLNGKQIGRKEGFKPTTKKSIQAKELILKHSKDFNGTLSDAEVIKLADISRNSYYKYKSELKNEQ